MYVAGKEPLPIPSPAQADEVMVPLERDFVFELVLRLRISIG
jgi:hypothetical protein